MNSRLQYVQVMIPFVMAVLLAACGGSGSTTTAMSTTNPAVFYAHSVAIKNGKVYAWGYNGYGQLGIDNIDKKDIPTPVTLDGMTGVSTGGTHTLAFKENGGVFAWGNNGFGQLGIDNQIAKEIPVTVKIDPTTVLNNIIAVSAGGNHSLALDSNKNVWAWGDNSSGQLGDGTTDPRKLAVKVGPAGTPLTDVIMIAAGSDHSLALKSDGTVLAWGSNANGQLGSKTISDKSTEPVPVSTNMSSTAPLNRIVAIAAGGGHSLALDDSGGVWAWGLNSVGQLGLGDENFTNMPYAVKVGMSNDLTVYARPEAPAEYAGKAAPGMLAAGLDHSLVLDAAGKVWAWGLNFSGQLGDGNASKATAGTPTPVPVVKVDVNNNKTILSNITSIVAIGNHSLAFSSTEAWAWGANTFGQLGIGANPDGTTTDRAFAVKVLLP